ncbi:hypothetical protein [Amycolatopsis regifaucium]|uniref:Cell division protein FtsL n=1 Tax=Amycolatopsis regifaucium TaxID=546365 RepID=A0A154MMK1_9PSEU|nr:hypothetical protein [Amycolatopsis regifaucium]KZB84619.1 hypothetical protein AVL48_33120 [Amycolatopsis regifaucium]OKA11083.1 hypothetical protein ATP06_0202785 [Amycolatopsis regifaucium]SFI28032.1 hypothetical protein SAMN04489731_109305 [Amycolatopsis regifaucium]
MTAPAKSRGRRGAPAPGRRARATSTVDETPETAAPGTTPPSRASRGRTSAAERAYARRAQRADLLQRDQRRNRPDAEGGAGKEEPGKKLKLRWPRSRASFVLMMMGMLAVGVACTLWLTTQAIADSYRLEQLRTANAGLAEAKERLQREVAKAESPASLAPKARELGMVPGGDPAHIVVGPDGQSTVVGEPKKAQGEAPPVSAAPPPPAEGTQQGGLIEGDQPAVPQENAEPQAQGGQ